MAQDLPWLNDPKFSVADTLHQWLKRLLYERMEADRLLAAAKTLHDENTAKAQELQAIRSALEQAQRQLASDRQEHNTRAAALTEKGNGLLKKEREHVASVEQHRVEATETVRTLSEAKDQLERDRMALEAEKQRIAVDRAALDARIKKIREAAA